MQEEKIKKILNKISIKINKILFETGPTDKDFRAKMAYVSDLVKIESRIKLMQPYLWSCIQKEISYLRKSIESNEEYEYEEQLEALEKEYAKKDTYYEDGCLAIKEFEQNYAEKFV